MKVKIEKVKTLCIKALEGVGLTKKEAEIVASEYLYGELTGKKSHGLIAFPNIIEKIKKRKRKWKIVKKGDNYALINGNGNLGQLVGKFAMELAIEKAKKGGIGLVGIHNMHSYLMPGYYAKMAADKDIIGIVINNAMSRVAPFGGIEPRIGTNPVAIAFPTKDIPFVLDMATSKRAMGEVRLAEKVGELLKDDFAIDKHGKVTRNPDKVNALKPFDGYKGYGLGLAFEILAGSLVRAKMGSKIVEGIDRGFLFIVIDPGVFIDVSTFKREVSSFLKNVKSSRKAKGVKEVLIPGERARRIMKKNLNRGYLEIGIEEIQGIKELS